MTAPPKNNNLPPVIVAIIAIVLTALLAFNVWADSRSEEYDGYLTTLLLGGIIAGLLNIARTKWGDGGDGK